MRKLFSCLSTAFWTGVTLLGGHSVAASLRATLGRALRYRAAGLILAGLFAVPQAEALQLTVSWDINSLGQLGFNVERSSNGSSFAQVATVAATINSYTDLNLPAGTYSYRVRAFDATTFSAYSNVATADAGLTAPTFTTQPSSTSASAGASVSFTAVAVGAPTPTIQWNKNGLPIAGATSSTLALTNISSSNAGTYTAVASNSAGTVTSIGGVLSVTVVLPPTPPPQFTTQPASASVVSGTSVSFTAIASGSPTPTLQWKKNGVAINGATTSTLTFSSVSAVDAGTYTLVATNTGGSVPSSGAVLTVVAPPPPAVTPTFTTQPSSASAASGTNVSFTVVATGSPTPTLQWKKNGVAISGATSSTLALSGISSSDAGSYSVVASNAGGTATSDSALLTVLIPPSFTSQPASAAVASAATVSFTVVATGSPMPSLQWTKNGAALVGATSSTLTLTNVSTSDSATYVAVATNSLGAASSNSAVLTVAAAPLPPPPTPPAPAPVVAGKLQNFSARAVPTQQGDSLGLDFQVKGAAKSILVRAIGPALSSLTSMFTVTDPKVSLSSGGTFLAYNDNWGGGSALSSTFAQVGAFPLLSTSKDAALLNFLAPGSYSATVGGKNGGLAMVEVYDADSGAGRISRVDVRAPVGRGDARLIGGFTITGTTPVHLLLRAVGPGLGSGRSLLSDPKLELYGSGGLLQKNDNWGGGSALSAAFAKAGATWLSSRSKDAAIEITLPPGTYTATVSGVNNSTGTAQLELYELP